MLNHQIIYFKNGDIKSIFNIDGIRNGRLLHLHIKDGRTYLINEKEVNFVEVIPDGMGKDVWGAEFGVLHTNNRRSTAKRSK